jgi:diguanylate cyclase (GGDEF)-like protein
MARDGAGSDAGAHDLTDADRLASRSAQVLLFGAGLITTVNSLVSHLDGVNIEFLRATGLLTMVASFAVPFLPWPRHRRLCSWGIITGALATLVGADAVHHYSRSQSAIAVYPVFFIVVIAWAGLTQPRGASAGVAAVSGLALAWLLHSGGHGEAAWQCVAVTVPAAALLGEAISWSYDRALQLADLDVQRRVALEALVAGASRLQLAVTAQESEAILVDTATAMFAGRGTRFEPAEHAIDEDRARDDASYDERTGEIHIRLRGQSGVLGTVCTVVDHVDAFVLDMAQLYSQQIGTRLEQLRVIDALTEAATRDALTGIGNRRAAETSIATLQPGDALFLLDLDHFKTVNDSLGHQTGDRVLTQLGEYLRAATRPDDAICRYGGEEFLLISPAAHDGAALVAERLLDGWRATRPLVSFSVGFAIHEAGATVDVTLEHADLALYEAKREGRNCARAYTPHEREAATP